MSPHLFIVHFPVALLITAAVMDAVGLALDNQSVRDTGWRLMIVAAVTGLLAFGTGGNASLNLYGGDPAPGSPLEVHQLWGSLGVWVLGIAALLRTLWRRKPGVVYAWVNLIVIVAAAAFVVAITLSGTAVRHGG